MPIIQIFTLHLLLTTISDQFCRLMVKMTAIKEFQRKILKHSPDTKYLAHSDEGNSWRVKFKGGYLQKSMQGVEELGCRALR